MTQMLLEACASKLEAPHSEFCETIIVGGGMSGLGCAHRLLENSQSFLMISPEIGGRVRTSPDGRVNYGAYYVTADYEHTLPLVQLGPRVRLTDAWFHRNDQRYRLISPRALKHLPAALRFQHDLRMFRKHFNAMNAVAENHSRRELITADPLLRATYHQSAAEYIRSRRLEGLFSDYIDHLLWASFFHDPYQVSTFFLLAASLPLIVPMYTFEFDSSIATAGFEDKILKDSIARIDIHGRQPRVVTKRGRVFRCNNLVMATPMDITNRLLGTLAQPIRGGIDVSFYHVRGKLKANYEGKTRNFFPSEEGAIISREADGSFLYFYQQDQIQKYFDSYEVITHDRWHPALFFHGSALLNSQPSPNIFIASDHDVPSIENAYINGRYAAALVLRHNLNSGSKSLHPSSPTRAPQMLEQVIC